MPQERRFVSQTHPLNLLAPLPHCQDHFDHVIDVALGVNAARNGQPHQVHLAPRRKHQRANLHRANSAFQIQLRSQRHAGKLLQRNVRQESARIQIDGVAARRLHDRHAGSAM